MKALSLHQPWASLVAVGVKTIETRSWSTLYRGPLAIHATLKRPPYAVVGVGLAGPVRGDDPHWAMDLRDGQRIRLPLGGVVATCMLVDVVPMVHSGEEGAIRTLDIDADGSLWIVEAEGDDPEDRDQRDVSAQRPYGEFTPGRFAWLLSGIAPVEPPIPAKGRQGLWTWEPE